VILWEQSVKGSKGKAVEDMRACGAISDREAVQDGRDRRPARSRLAIQSGHAQRVCTNGIRFQGCYRKLMELLAFEQFHRRFRVMLEELISATKIRSVQMSNGSTGRFVSQLVMQRPSLKRNRLVFVVTLKVREVGR
jgi:hypothetical protein